MTYEGVPADELQLALVERDAARMQAAHSISAAVLVLVWLLGELVLRGETSIEARGAMLLAIGGLTAGRALASRRRRETHEVLSAIERTRREDRRIEAARQDERVAVVRQLRAESSVVIDVAAVRQGELPK